MQRMSKLTVGILGLGHFVTDSYGSIIYLLLPILKVNLGLSFYQVFWLMPLYQASSSLMQPAYGYVSDRYFRRICAVLGPAITAVFISSIGFSFSYPMLIGLMILGGVGIGAFHPQAAAIASQASGSSRRLGISVFSAMGNCGAAVGPSLAALVIGASNNLHRLPYMAVTGLAATLFLFKFCPPLESPPRKTEEPARSSFTSDIKSVWRPFVLLYFVTVLVSATQSLTVTYLPFLLGQRHFSSQRIGFVLTAFLLFGGLGGLFGGVISDRIGSREFTFYSRLLAPLLLVLAFLTSGTGSLVLLALGGLASASTIPVNIAMAQELMPRQTSTVSALMMGFAWGLGSIMPVTAEPFRSHFGFLKVLIGSVTILGLVGIFCSYRLLRLRNYSAKEVVEPLMISPLPAEQPMQAAR